MSSDDARGCVTSVRGLLRAAMRDLSVPRPDWGRAARMLDWAATLLDVSGRDMCTRLADLIEPGDMSHGCRDTVACDREALLALADEMDKWAITCDHYDRQVSPLDVTKYARRIREACGVVG